MKLMVHIGAGKTGSSSIQAALEASTAKLAEQKMKYLGHMLEHGLVRKKPSWQKHSGSPDFFTAIEREDAIEQLKSVLLQEIRHPDHATLDALIWSNEWMSERPDRLLPALKLVEDNGVDIEIVVYVRRHDRWIASSYVQWGLKNKSYPGPIRGFPEWLEGMDFSLQRVLQPWLGAFGDAVSVLNFDAANDVVEHFFHRLGILLDSAERKNVSPPAAELAAWAVFNNRYKDRVPEDRFESWLRQLRLHQENSCSVPEPASLLPTADDLTALQDRYRDDRAFINGLLSRSGEPEFKDDGEVKPYKTPTGWEMDRLLLEMLFHMNARLSALERKLREKK